MYLKILINILIMDVACGVMKNRKGQILLGLRPENRPYAGYWEFPGGKKEKGETIDECLKREWMEELNLHIHIDKEIYRCQYKNTLCIFFYGDIIDEENLKMNVHKDIVFSDKKNIKDFRLFKSDYIIPTLI